MTAATVPTSSGHPPSPTSQRNPAVTSALRALRLRRTQIGLFICVVIVLITLVGPFLAPHSVTASVGLPFDGRSGDARLGTDNLGRDVLSRVLHGGRSVLWMSCSSAALGVVLGGIVGMVAGYLGDRTDAVLMRTMDLLMAFPQIVLVLLFVSLLGSSQWLIVLLVALAWTPQVARISRGITAETAAKEFVQAAEVLGVPRHRILASEVLPNLSTPLLVEFGLRLTWSIALIAGLSFLGYGIQPPAADWGLMINENRDALALQPWSVVIPVAMIALFTIGTNLITEGLAFVVAGLDRKSGSA